MVRRKRIIVVIDLAGFTKAFQTTADDKMVAFLHDYYGQCEKLLTPKGGDVIKFIGDACLAVFDPRYPKNAVEAVRELQSSTETLNKKHNLNLRVGANLHLAYAVDVAFSIGSDNRKDIIGRGVNEAFLLGRGPGIRISESFYRSLPASFRSIWSKQGPVVTYYLDA